MKDANYIFVYKPDEFRPIFLPEPDPVAPYYLKGDYWIDIVTNQLHRCIIINLGSSTIKSYISSRNN